MVPLSSAPKTAMAFLPRPDGGKAEESIVGGVRLSVSPYLFNRKGFTPYRRPLGGTTPLTCCRFAVASVQEGAATSIRCWMVSTGCRTGPRASVGELSVVVGGRADLAPTRKLSPPNRPRRRGPTQPGSRRMSTRGSRVWVSSRLRIRTGQGRRTRGPPGRPDTSTRRRPGRAGFTGPRWTRGFERPKGIVRCRSRGGRRS